jgi:hypothetical protein
MTWSGGVGERGVEVGEAADLHAVDVPVTWHSPGSVRPVPPGSHQRGWPVRR